MRLLPAFTNSIVLGLALSKCILSTALGRHAIRDSIFFYPDKFFTRR
jgi:hypothetical protein